MSEYRPTPVEPQSWLWATSGVDHLLAEIRALSNWQRWLLTIGMGSAAVSLFWGAYALTRLHHWVALAFAVFLLEPLGLFAALAAVYSLAPTSSAGRWFAVTLRRATLVPVVLFSLMVAGTAVVVGWLGWELYRNW